MQFDLTSNPLCRQPISLRALRGGKNVRADRNGRGDPAHSYSRIGYHPPESIRGHPRLNCRIAEEFATQARSLQLQNPHGTGQLNVLERRSGSATSRSSERTPVVCQSRRRLARPRPLRTWFEAILTDQRLRLRSKVAQCQLVERAATVVVTGGDAVAAVDGYSDDLVPIHRQPRCSNTEFHPAQ